MALTIEQFITSSWVDITASVPLLGNSELGLQAFQMEQVRESNISVLRFSCDVSNAAMTIGREMRVMVDGDQWFGGYITTREQMRYGAAGWVYGANYECQDYNVLLDRIVVAPTYTIDQGDTDSTEIETLRSTYLNGAGVTAGDIQTVEGSMPADLELLGTFRQCMEKIAGAAGGAVFFINPDKELNYAAAGTDFSLTGTENLSDDLTVANSHPYGDFVERSDESRRVTDVYIIGDGIEGWYPSPASGFYYQKIIVDETIKTQAALDALGASIVDDFGSALVEYSLRCWEDSFWTQGEATVRHSDFIGGSGEVLWIRRALCRARSDDGSEREFILEMGDHTIESHYMGPAPGEGGTGGLANHNLLSDPYHADTSDNTPVRGDLIIANSTPLWDALAHPTSAGYALTTDATDVAWDQTPAWTGLHTFNAGWILGGGTGHLSSNDLIIDTDGDSYLHASADDVVDLVLATASGEFGIHINGAEDFTFTANAFNVLSGSSIQLAQYMYHAGDGDTFLSFTDDAILFTAGGVGMLTLTEAATDTILCGARVDLNGNDLILDVDADSYLHASADDVINLIIGGNDQYQFSATELALAGTDGTDRLKLRTHGDVASTAADIYASVQLGLAAESNVFVFIDADNNTSNSYFTIAKDTDNVSAADTAGESALFRVTEASQVLINATSNSDQTIGLFINQGANDDHIFDLASSDVSHPFTAYADNNTFGYMRKSISDAGGLQIVGLKSSTGVAGYGIVLDGLIGEAVNTTKTTAGIGAVVLRAYTTNGGTSTQAVGADGNLVTISNASTTRFIFDAEGSAHADVEWITFDEHDDLVLLDELESSFGEFAEGHRTELEALGIAHFDDRPGHAMVNWTRLQMLLVGAVRQLADRVSSNERLLLQGGQ